MDMLQLEQALSEFRPLLASDGGDLLFESADELEGVVVVRLLIGEATCTECIVEPQMLREILTEFLMGKAIDGLRAVEVIDPRLAEVAG